MRLVLKLKHDEGTVARIMVSANHLFKSIVTLVRFYGSLRWLAATTFRETLALI